MRRRSPRSRGGTRQREHVAAQARTSGGIPAVRRARCSRRVEHDARPDSPSSGSPMLCEDFEQSEGSKRSTSTLTNAASARAFERGPSPSAPATQLDHRTIVALIGALGVLQWGFRNPAVPLWSYGKRSLSAVTKRAALIRTVVRMEATIEVQGLRKRFGSALAVDGCPSRRPGQVTGFVGPTGRGSRARCE